MTDSHRPLISRSVLPYEVRDSAPHQSIRPSAFLFAVTFYSLSVGMTYSGEAFFGAPKGEWGAAADAMLVAWLATPFALLALITFAITAKATAAKAAFPAFAAIEGTVCGIVIASMVCAGNALNDRIVLDIVTMAVAVLSPVFCASLLGFLSRRALAKERLE